MEDMEVINMVNRNSDVRALARKLNAISARRKKGCKHVQKMRKLRRKS